MAGYYAIGMLTSPIGKKRMRVLVDDLLKRDAFY